MLSAAPSFSWTRFARDPHRPGAVRSSLPSASESLWISPFGRGRVHELAVGVGERAGDGDLRAASPAAVAGRRERPQDRPAVGVDRDRLAVGGRDHDHVVGGAVDGHAVQVDRRGVDRPGSETLMWRRCATLAAVMPVASSLTSLRCGSRPNSGQSSSSAAEAAWRCGIALTLTVGCRHVCRGGAPSTPPRAHRPPRRVPTNVRRRARIGPGFSASRRLAEMAKTPQVGEQAPDFELQGTGGAVPSLRASRRARRAAVLPGR